MASPALKIGKKGLEIPEVPLFNVVSLYRERGNYLQRLELFEKAIQAYDEALRWNKTDVRSLLGRSVARAKMTHYSGALADVATANALDPENITAQQIRAQINYEKCAFEKALVLASRSETIRRFPPHFANCVRQAEQTIRDSVGKSASKVLSSAGALLKRAQLNKDSIDADTPQVLCRKPRMQANTKQQCVDVSLEGEVVTTEAALQKREREMVSLMQDDDFKSAAQHLFRRMSVLPANSLARARTKVHGPAGGQSIMPPSQQPTRIAHKSRHPLGFQDFDI